MWPTIALDSGPWQKSSSGLSDTQFGTYSHESFNLFFFIWASDTGAYFSGRAFGKHKLFERISPNKTIEGFIGGLVASALVGIAAHHFLGEISLISWMCIGAFVSITSTLGDLFESMLKRQSDIKDSGNILPGHGGILDRFDSTLISAPIYWFLLHVFM